MGEQKELEKLLFEDWVEESYTFGKEIVYNGIRYNDTPSDEYLSRAYQVIRKRIALGGYRLAKLIVDIYNVYEEQKRVFLAEKFLK
jgi:hypothetical protein